MAIEKENMKRDSDEEIVLVSSAVYELSSDELKIVAGGVYICHMPRIDK